MKKGFKNTIYRILTGDTELKMVSDSVLEIVNDRYLSSELYKKMDNKVFTIKSEDGKKIYRLRQLKPSR